jgi:hypothetical protein
VGMTQEKYANLKKIIEDSGHPVSLKASTILQKKGWNVRNSPRYPSKIEPNVLMEIDIVCRKESKLLKDASCELIIECKKQNDPWIFFTQNQRNGDAFTLNVNFAGFYEGYISNSKENELPFQNHFYYDKNLCTYFIVGGKKIDDGRKPRYGGPSATIDRAINQVYKAINFYLHQGYNEIPEFYFPIIVFDGELFEASYPNGELEIKPSNHISLYFEVEFDKPEFLENVKSTDYRLSKPYIIDVVKLNYLEQFLDEIDQKL